MQPNFILMVLDATRYDAIISKNREVITPNIKSLAEEGIVFHNAFSTAPWTPPSHASLFTGLYPPEHGVMCDTPIDEKTTTIAQILNKNGYFTFGTDAGDYVNKRMNSNKGFQHFFELNEIKEFKNKKYEFSQEFLKCLPAYIANKKKWKELFRLEKFNKFISQAKNENKPFFGFINFKTAHSPYKPSNKDKSDKLKKIEKKLTKKELKKIYGLADRDGYGYMAKKIPVSQKEWQIIKLIYQAEVNYADHLVGKIAKFLKKQNLYDQTMIIITADHGENLGEKGLAYHQFCLYNTLLHVPLIIKTPKHWQIDSQISDKLASLADIPFSIADSIGIKMRSNGINIFKPEQKNEHIYATYVPANGCLGLIKKYNGDPKDFKNNLKAIITPEWKFIAKEKGEPELYNLKTDFSENKNLITEYPTIAFEMHDILTKRFSKTSQEIKKADYSKYEEKIRQSLANLGYL